MVNSELEDPKAEAVRQALIARLRQLWRVDAKTNVEVYCWPKEPYRISEISISTMNPDGTGGGCSFMQSDDMGVLLRAERWMLQKSVEDEDPEEMEREDQMLAFAAAESHKLEQGVYSNGVLVVEGWIEEAEAKLKKTKPNTTERRFFKRVLANLHSAKQSLDLVYTGFSNRRQKGKA